MRIISGTLKGRVIMPPSGFKARPTTDFAKEGLFNVLSNNFDFEGLRVLDLFAGTGGISIEFASRGAGKIISVEMNPLHAGFIRDCSRKYRLDCMKVVRSNVFDFLGICKLDFDIVFADPPYDMDGFETIPDKVLAAKAAGSGLIRTGGCFIFEHPAAFSFSGHPLFIQEKKYGNVHFSFFRSPAESGSQAPAPKD